MTLALAEKTAAVQKICPLPSELSFITKNIPCPEEGCNGTFLNSSNLEMHLSKHHKKRSDGSNKRDNVNKMNYQYHCPVEKCLYNINSDRYFSHIKYLKQHYLKVHAEKKFLCKKCDKGFSTEAARNVHMRICGMKFTCSCGCTYLSYEALITHAKRKNHTFDANLKLYAKGQATPKVHPLVKSEAATTGGNSITLIGDTKKSPYILVNTQGQSLAGIPINVQPLSTILPAISPSPLTSRVDIGVQTERGFGCNSRRTSGGNSNGRRLSAQTQTWSVKRSKICAGTQTQGDYILKRAMRAAQIPINNVQVKEAGQSMAESVKLPGPGGRKRKKSMETQTVVVSVEESPLIVNSTINPSELSRSQQSKLIEGVFVAEPNDENADQASRGMDVVQLPTQNSYQVPIIDPWIHVYPKCNSGTQTSPPSLKTVCHPVVTQTDVTGILLRETIAESQNQNIQCYYSMPNIKHNTPIVSRDVAIDSNCGIPEFSGVTTNINADDFAESDYSSTQFDPMLASEKLTSMEEVNVNTGSFGIENEVQFRDSDVYLVDNISNACSTETQTEGEAMSSDPTLSHIETQTNTEDLVSCCFEQLLHSNMCTQTCEDMLFSDLGFSDIQTQTQEEIRFWQSGDNSVNDAAGNTLSSLVSTETQTAISGHCPVASSEEIEELNNPLWMSEMTHMETQTDVDELRKLIAELTKHDIEGD